MNREERERLVDRLLSETLAQQPAEPRAGLENRILANLRAQPEPRPWQRWLWAPAVALIAIGLMVSRRPEPVKTPVAVEHRPAAPMTAELAPPAPVVATHRKPARRSSARAITVAKTEPLSPRQPVFAPARLTEAEHALIAALRSHPEEAQVVLERQEQTRQEAAEYMEQAFRTQE